MLTGRKDGAAEGGGTIIDGAPERTGADGAVADLDGAVSALFLRLYPRLVAVAGRVLGDPDAAEDVAQEAFVALVRRGLAHSDRAEGWLFAATVHGALNALRSGGRRLRRERTEGMRFAADRAVRERDEDPAVAAERAERRRLLRRAMARLPRAKAAILALRYGGLSYAEVARALGVRTGSVGTLLRRAEAALRKEFDDAARP